MKWFGRSKSRIILSWTWISIFKFFLLYQFNFQWHVGAIQNFIHMWPDSSEGKGCTWLVIFLLRFVDRIRSWSRIDVISRTESFMCISGPIYNIFLFANRARYLIASRTGRLLSDYVTLHIYRLLHLRILRVRQYYPNKLFISINRIYLPFIIILLYLIHFGLCA